MKPVFLFFLVTVTGGMASSYREYCGPCQHVETVDIDIGTIYSKQPVFVSFMLDTEENRLLDNVCLTYFPLPDSPNTYTLYTSTVYCDGSNSIFTSVDEQIRPGVIRNAAPFLTVTNNIVGYPGCDTYVVYQCFNYAESCQPIIFGAGFTCKPLALSCLRKVEEVIKDRGLPLQDFYVLPMKLPNRCVTQQLCLQPPNPFYNKLPGVGVSRL